MAISYIFYKLEAFFKLDCSNIWVMGGSLGEYYDDNGLALYQYIKKKYPELEIFWVIKRNSSDISKVKKNNPLIYKNSIKANYLILKAKVIITTHSLRGDISSYPFSFYKNTFFVHIFHGIHAFKRKEEKKLSNYLIKCNLIIASGINEKKIKNCMWGIEKKKIHITGFPQHDSLLEKFKNNNENESVQSILYMPTWRSWLLKKSALLKGGFSKSDFFCEIINFLNNKSLNKFLVDNNIRFNLSLHRNLHIFYDYFVKAIDSDNINILDKNINVQEQIIHHNLLITDYSSIAWEFLLLNKPVIFYQFDQEKYLEYTGAYIDFKKDLFGPVVKNCHELVNEIQKAVENKFSVEKDYSEIRKNFIQFNDQKNCERVMNAILEELATIQK